MKSKGTDPERRRLLKIAGAAAVAASLPRWAKTEGAKMQAQEHDGVPVDKGISPNALEALLEREEPQWVTGDALDNIGMPVGGLFCGCVYLSGDGRLWLWDIFNRNQTGVTSRDGRYKGNLVPPGNGGFYVDPLKPFQPFDQGFALRIGTKLRPMDRRGWSKVRFLGEYPVGNVDYADDECPLAVRLEAFSPYIPHETDDSSMPCTLMRYTVVNRSHQAVEFELLGWAQNPVGLENFKIGELVLQNQTCSGRSWRGVHLTGLLPSPSKKPRKDVEVELWERDTYAPWIVEGTAFGSGPILKTDIPSYQGQVGGPGTRCVNSHASAPGNDSVTHDQPTGKLVGPAFAVARKAINFWIGGGNNPGTTCLNLIVDGKVVRTATGHNHNLMRRDAFDVAEFEGKEAHLEIIDQESGGWGHIGVGQIVQSDVPHRDVPLSKRADYGTFAIAALSPTAVSTARLGPGLALTDETNAERPIGEALVGAISQKARLEPGKATTITFMVAWHFPNLRLGLPDDDSGRHYGKRFKDAKAVVDHVSRQSKRLVRNTLLWRDTLFNSTLPRWFLDRCHVNTSILATTTCHRFGTGRFYAWEGVGCCPGTCTHVWQYAQAMGRLFPDVERDQRERVDFGLALHEDTGEIGHRAEFGTGAFVDGQAGTILRAYREHLMCTDDAYLKRLWPKIRKATEYLMSRDKDLDGILDGAQENTLDAAWFGKIAWLSSLYIAALRASEEMAFEMGDRPFARTCREVFERGRRAIDRNLFNGEYYIQLRDPALPDALGTYNCCHIDQVFGQSWAWQVGLGRILDKDQTVSALKALYKYNFVPDIGPFREKHPRGRWYAIEGDAGLVMATNPKGDDRPYGDPSNWQFMYFNECMSGFEHQAASHMIAEGLILEGLAVIKAIHDRYGPEKRNPYNEVECSDHYARAMASFGSLLTMSGFECHGPKGHIGFAPRTDGLFMVPFVAAGSWGTFSQIRDLEEGEPQVVTLKVAHGELRLKTFSVNTKGNEKNLVSALLNGKELSVQSQRNGDSLLIRFNPKLTVGPGSTLMILIEAGMSRSDSEPR